MMSLWDALRMNMMISYQELVRTFLSKILTANVIIMPVTNIKQPTNFCRQKRVIECYSTVFR
ncbi:hypothetical protein KONIH1_09710 [Klebsiella oxytoca KONIH1]|nr:hypothetical protein KONIH1_09710 [Klebsiella oxytoca KONIH1]